MPSTLDSSHAAVYLYAYYSPFIVVVLLVIMMIIKVIAITISIAIVVFVDDIVVVFHIEKILDCHIQILNENQYVLTADPFHTSSHISY